jgi:hypothetical protein
MPLACGANNTRVASVPRSLEAANTGISPASLDHTTGGATEPKHERIPYRRELFLWIDVVIPATGQGHWQLLEKPLGVMPGRLFLLTWEGGMPNDKPLKPDDFPVEVEGDELMTADGKPIAKAKTPDIAEDIADRLNEDDYRKEQDRWSA